MDKERGIIDTFQRDKGEKRMTDYRKMKCVSGADLLELLNVGNSHIVS